MSTAATSVADVVKMVHTKLLDRDLSQGSEHQRDAIRSCVTSMAPLLAESDVRTAVDRVERQLFGLAELEPLLGDPQVTEVMINGPGRVWVERHGTLSPTKIALDQAMLRVVIERIVAPLGLRVDRTQPFVDARLADGSRVHIAVPPLALDGPYVTIRRFRSEPHELGDFCNPRLQRRLEQAVTRRCNILVSGGTGSGKTSMLNALANYVAPTERVLTIEDAAELQLPGEHTVRLEARPSNAEGVGAVSIRTLLRNALRMRPDRLIVGEVRGAEALDMIQAMNTGHAGSMSTCHANSASDALSRVEAMALMGQGDLPLEVVRTQLASALDLVVHVERTGLGARRVHSLYERDPNSAQRWVLHVASD